MCNFSMQFLLIFFILCIYIFFSLVFKLIRVHWAQHNDCLFFVSLFFSICSSLAKFFCLFVCPLIWSKWIVESDFFFSFSLQTNYTKMPHWTQLRFNLFKWMCYVKMLEITTTTTIAKKYSLRIPPHKQTNITRQNEEINLKWKIRNNNGIVSARITTAMD